MKIKNITVDTDGTVKGTKVSLNGKPIGGLGRFKLEADSKKQLVDFAMEFITTKKGKTK